jgi:hypothetical protein
MYYYRYYGSWGGWENDADEKTRITYILGKLITRQMWAGQKVHEGIKNILEGIQNNNESISLQNISDNIIGTMREEFKDSRRGRYLKEPKTCALFEHEYNVDLPKCEWENTANHVVGCLKTFFDSNVFKLICNIPHKQWLEIEKFSKFRLGDISIYVKPDFAFKTGENTIIYDWKTGRLGDEDHPLQPSCYGLYAISILGTRPINVKVLEFYLSSKELKEYVFSNSEIEFVTQNINSSIASMIEMLDDRETNSAAEERFGFSEDERTCNYCNFFKVCSRFA